MKRGGFVLQAQRLVYHSTLGSRGIEAKKKARCQANSEHVKQPGALLVRFKDDSIDESDDIAEVATQRTTGEPRS